MIDVTVPLLGEVFWIERLVARQWERVEVYIQAFRITSQLIMYKRALATMAIALARSTKRVDATILPIV